jgi:hypothetical protein
LIFCKFNPQSEAFEDLEIQQTFVVDKILAMRAFNEFIFLIYWNGYVKVYHKIDRYWDEDLEQICLTRNLDKKIMIVPLTKNVIGVVEWPSPESYGQSSFNVHTLDV